MRLDSRNDNLMRAQAAQSGGISYSFDDAFVTEGDVQLLLFRSETQWLPR